MNKVHDTCRRISGDFPIGKAHICIYISLISNRMSARERKYRNEYPVGGILKNMCPGTNSAGVENERTYWKNMSMHALARDSLTITNSILPEILHIKYHGFLLAVYQLIPLWNNDSHCYNRLSICLFEFYMINRRYEKLRLVIWKESIFFPLLYNKNKMSLRWWYTSSDSYAASKLNWSLKWCWHVTIAHHTVHQVVQC